MAMPLPHSNQMPDNPGDEFENEEVDYAKYIQEFERMQLERALLEPFIEPHRDILEQMRKLRHVQITHVVSPSDFYIKFIDVEAAAEMYTKMQAYYNNPASLAKLKYEPLFDVKLYLWKYPIENGFRWERVRVTKRNMIAKICRIFLVDIGEFFTVRFDELYHLATEFSQFAPEAVRVYLLDVKPLVSTTDWSEEAIAAFKELCVKGNYNGIATKKYYDKEKSEFMEHCTRFGVILAMKSSCYTLNAEMCRLGFAEPVGLSASRFDLFDDIIYHGEKHPDISFGSDLTLTKLNLILNEPEPEKRKAVKKPKETIFRDVLLRRTLDEEDYRTEVKLPPSFRKRLGACRAVYFITSSCFYIQMFEKMPLYNQMLKYMAKIKSNLPAIKADEIKEYVGKFVLVSIVDGQVACQRAFVKEVLDGVDLLKIACIDTGKMLSVRSGLVHPIPECLTKIPSFCYRVHIDGYNTRPSGSSSWSGGSREICGRYIKETVNKDFVSYAWTYSNGSVCHLEDFGQEVSYESEKRWMPVALSQFAKPATVETRSNFLLRPLFTSIGIELGFEAALEDVRVNRVNHLESFRLDKATEILEACGYALKK